MRILALSLGCWLALAGASLAAAQTSVWTARGPASIESGMLGAVASPIYALAQAGNGTWFGGGLGGVWSYNGNQWLALSPGQPVSALAISPDGTVYAGTGLRNGAGGSGILASRDGGASWQWLDAGALSGLTITHIAVDAANASHMLVATVAGAGSNAVPGLYASADGGDTWSGPLISGPIWDLAWSGGDVLAIAGEKLEWSGDDGASFEQLTSPLLPSTWTQGAAAVQPGAGFLALLQGPQPALVAVSLDGQTIAPITLPTDWTASTALSLAADSSHVWIGSSDLWVSSNGSSWSNLTNFRAAGATVHAGQEAIAPLAGGGIMVANDGGVWRYSSAGAWTNLNSTLDNFAPLALALPASTITAAMAGSGIASGTTSAWTIAPQNAGLPIQWVALDPADSSAQSLYGATSGALYHSSDSGNDWTLSVASTGITITALAATDDAALLGTASGQLVTGSGATLASPAVGQPITALAATADGQVLLVAAAAQLWFSSDAGANWQTLTNSDGPVSALAINPASPSQFALATPAGVAVSWNNGNGWVQENSGLSAAPVTGLEFDSSGTLWAATLGRGVFSASPSQQSLNLSLSVSPASAAVNSPVQFQAVLTSPQGPVADATVTITGTGSGATASASAITNGAGTASGSVNLPTLAGAISWIASVQTAVGTVDSSVETVTAVPAAPMRLLVISGGGQQQTAGAALANPILLQVTDAYGNGVAGISVAISDGVAYSATLQTDAAGKVSISGYDLPSMPGLVTFTASAGSLGASWSETALPGPDYQLLLTPPSGPVAPNQIAVFPLQVIAIGGFNQPVPLLCSPVPGCSIVVNGQTVTSVAPGAAAEVDFGVGAVGAGQSSAVVSVAGDATHVANATVLLQTLGVALSSNSISLEAGASAQIPVTVSGVNGFSGAVSLTVVPADGDSMPATLSASVVPASVTLTSASASGASALMLTSASSAATLPGTEPGARPGERLPPWLMLLTVGWLGLLAMNRRQPRRRMAILLAYAALAVAACGGSPAAALDPPPAPQTTVISLAVTASSGGLQVSAPLTLTLTTP